MGGVEGNPHPPVALFSFANGLSPSQRCIEYAMELAGGAGFYRAAGLERRFRDIQAARYHPLQPAIQAEYAGALALGLPVDRIF